MAAPPYSPLSQGKRISLRHFGENFFAYFAGLKKTAVAAKPPPAAAPLQMRGPQRQKKPV